MACRETEEAINRQLQRSSYLALRDIRCVCRNGVIALKGCLPTHYLKQLLLEIVAEIAGDCAIESEIEVIGPAQRPPTGHERSRTTDPQVRSLDSPLDEGAQ
jgi:hypothetical protein